MVDKTVEPLLATLTERIEALTGEVRELAALRDEVQPLLALAAEFRELLRRYPSVGRTIMRAARHFGEEEYAALFWLADRCGLPLVPNDATLRQQHFTQGLLVPGRRAESGAS